MGFLHSNRLITKTVRERVSMFVNIYISMYVYMSVWIYANANKNILACICVHMEGKHSGVSPCWLPGHLIY